MECEILINSTKYTTAKWQNWKKISNLHTVECIVSYLDLQNWRWMAYEKVSNLQKSFNICSKEHWHPWWTPCSWCQPRRRGCHAQNSITLQILRPYLTCITTNSKEVFGIKWVPLQWQNFALVTLKKLNLFSFFTCPEDFVPFPKYLVFEALLLLIELCRLKHFPGLCQPWSCWGWLVHRSYR